MKLKLKEQLLGFLLMAPIFVAIPVACLETARQPPAVEGQAVVDAPLNLKAVVDAERAEADKKPDATEARRSDRR